MIMSCRGIARVLGNIRRWLWHMAMLISLVRGTIIAHWIVLLTLTSGWAYPAMAVDQLRLGHTYPPDSTLGVWAQAMADELAERTGSYVEVNDSGNLGNSQDLLLSTVKEGIDLTLIPADVAAEVAPILAGLSLPALFPADERIDEFGGELIKHDEIDELVRDSELVLLGVGWSQGVLLSNGSPIRSPEDMIGRQVRVRRGSEASVLEGAGADVVRLPFSELYPAFQAGYIDTLVTSAIGVERMMLDPGHITQITISRNIGLFVNAFVMVMSRYRFENFSSNEQDAIREAGAQTATEFQQAERELLDRVLAGADVANLAVDEIPDEEIDRWRELAAEVAWDSFVHETPKGQLLIDFVSR